MPGKYPNNEHVYKIRLDKLNEIKDFYAAALSCKAQLFLMQGRYTVDPKSMLGIYALDLSQDLTLAAADDENDSVDKIFSKWIVK